MVRDVCHLIGVYTKTIMKSWLQYKVDAILRSLAVFLRESTGIIVVYFTLLKFDTLNGWNVYELLFLFSLLFVTYGILILFFTGLRDFGGTVRNCGFDRFILRPRGLLQTRTASLLLTSRPSLFLLRRSMRIFHRLL